MQPTNYFSTQKHSLRRFIIILVVILCVFAVADLIYQITSFHITGTNPNTNSVSVVAPFFKVNFNKPLASQDLSVSMSPSAISSYSVSGNTITMNFNQLRLGQAYVITVNKVLARDGKTIINKNFTFVAKDISVADLPADQQKAIVTKQDRYSGPANDPILSHLPYGTLDFNLSPLITTGSHGNSKLVLQASLLLTEADLNTNRQAAISQYEQEVQNYIRSLGLNPSNYTIQYIIPGS